MSESLIPRWEVGSIDLTSYPYSVAADSTVSIGDPEATVESVPSGLADGDLEGNVRYGNRTYELPIYIEGATLGELAQYEADLRRELRSSGLMLAHEPGDDFSPTSVHEVLRSQLTTQRNDVHESHLIRAFTLSLTCAPFARSEELTVVDALPVAAAAPTVVDTCDSATGWSAKVNGTTASVSTTWEAGAVSVVELVDPAPQTLELKRTGSITFTDSRYLVAEIGYNPTLGQVPVKLAVDGAKPRVATSIRILSAGWFEYSWDMTGVSSLTTANFSAYTSAAVADLKIREVRKMGAPVTIANRQVSRILEVGGTERTPASIHVEADDGTSDLGLTIVSTYPARYPTAGFDPAMSRWYSAGTRTSDVTSVSGWRYRLDNGFFVAQAPALSFPDGGYQMAGLIAASVEGDYEVASLVQTRKGGTILKEWANNEVVHLFTSPNWALVDLGVPSLPILRAESGTDVVLAVKVRQTNGADLVGVTVEAQDAWMLPVDEDCGLEVVLTDKAHLWLDSPTTTSGVPRVLEGDSADRSGATFPLKGARSGVHVLSPGLTGVTVITSVATAPKVSASYYKRWLHNAAE